MFRSLAAAAMAAAFFLPAWSEPRIPASDEVVLERLASRRDDPVSREMTALHAQLAREPRDLSSAVRLARLYVERARAEDDPRYFGRAQAALAPWWHLADAPTPVLMARAAIRQSQHAFDPAIADLREALRRDPRNPQAWLTLANVLNVTGDADAARASCERLAGQSIAVVYVACHAAITGGDAAQTRARLLAALAAAPSLPPEVRGWVVGIAGELAERAGQVRAAEASYREALAIDAADRYTLAALADLLLDSGRPAEALALLKGERISESLQLRRVIAQTRSKHPGAGAEAARLKARFAAAAARGDRIHLREESRFVLEIERDPARALELALENWRTQREPADARILLQAAAAAGEPGRVREVVRWVRQARLDSGAIGAAIRKLDGA